MSRELAATGDVDDLVAIAAHHLTEVFGAAVEVRLPDAEGTLRVRRTEGRFPLAENELALSRWGPTHTDQAHYVRVYLAHLRHKLETEPARPRYLLTEPGVGYRLATE